MTIISQGNLSTAQRALTPEQAKLVADVFAQKFTDSSNQNTKVTSNQTNSITQD